MLRHVRLPVWLVWCFTLLVACQSPSPAKLAATPFSILRVTAPDSVASPTMTSPVSSPTVVAASPTPSVTSSISATCLSSVSLSSPDATLTSDKNWQFWPSISETLGVFAVVYGDNYVWVGTASGVVRLDPSTLTYTTFDNLGRVIHLLPITDDQVFAVTGSGVFYFDGQTWRHLEFTASYLQNSPSIQLIGLTSSGDLFWLQEGATRSPYGLVRFKGHVPPLDRPWDEGDILTSYKPHDCENNWMFATWGLVYRSPEECRRYLPAQQQRRGTGAVDADGTYWEFYQGAWDGVKRYASDGSALSMVPIHYVQTVSADPKHGVWLGSHDSLFWSDGTSVRHIPIGLEGYTLYPPGTLVVDKTNQVWVSTERGPQYLSADGKEWRLAFEGDQRLADGVDILGPLNGDYFGMQLAAADDGGLWLLTTLGLIDYDGHSLEAISPPPPIVPSQPTDTVCALSRLAVDLSGNVWISADDGGLLQFDPRYHTWQRHLPTHRFSAVSTNQDSVYGLDSTEQIWLYTPPYTTWQPLARLVRSASNPLCSRMVVDRGGDIWVADFGLGELWRYQPSGSTLLAQCILKDKDNFPYALFVDQQNQVWVSTSNGLLRFSGHDWQIITTPPIGRVLAMAVALDGRLWFAGPQGVAVYDPKGNQP